MKLPINLSYEDFIKRVNDDKSSVILDVRTPEEYETFHLENSILCDIYNPNFVNQILSFDRNKNYYVYCQSGSRSFQAGIFMLQNGFEKVFNLANGIKKLISV